jgi:hypothetical protein
MDIQSLSHHLLNITKQKYKLLQQIYELTAKQSKVLSKKDLKEFLSLSHDKQDLIEKVNILDDEFEIQYHLLKSSTDKGTFGQLFFKYKYLKEIQNIIIQIKLLQGTFQEV